MERMSMQKLKLYKIDEDMGGPESYVAARHHGEALSLLIELAGGEPETEEFTVTFVPDDQAPDVRVQQSAEAGDREDLLLIELLDRARKRGKAELLSSSEF